MSIKINKGDYVVNCKNFNPFSTEMSKKTYFVKDKDEHFYILKNDYENLEVPINLLEVYFTKVYVWSDWKKYTLSDGTKVLYRNNRKITQMKGVPGTKYEKIKVKSTCDKNDTFSTIVGLNYCEERFLNKIKNLENKNVCKNKITYVQGDLLNCPSNYYIVHCANEAMFTGNEEPVGLCKILDEQYNLRKWVDKNWDYIHSEVSSIVVKDNLITLIVAGNRYSQVTEDILAEALENVANFVEEQCISNIAMPKICSGRSNGLPWETTEKIINEVFADVDVNIFVYEK